MSARKTVLLLSRGSRTHHLFLALAADLAHDHRVVVLADSSEQTAFASLAGVEVRCYRTPDIEFSRASRWTADRAVMQARAREIESVIGLSLYKAASNYLLYGRFVKAYGGRWDYLTDEHDILRAYVGAYDDLSDIFDAVKPDVVFYETIDLISSYVAFALARARGVFGLEFRFSPFGTGRLYPAFGLFRRNPVLEHLYAHRQQLVPESRLEAEAMLGSLQARFAEGAYGKLNRAFLNGNSPLSLHRIASALRDPAYAAQGFRNLKWHYQSARNRVWLRRRLHREAPTAPYIAFFLSHLPEASTCSEAPRWVNQDLVAEQLAINAPSHLRVLVKEHPRSYGSRGRGFFGHLMRLPNVTVCHPMMNTHQLLSGSEAVVAVSGTIGFEAILLGKRVGVLGRPFYSIYRGAKTLQHPDEIYEAIRDPSWRPEAMEDERRDFLAAYLQASYPFTHGERTSIYPKNGGHWWAQALRNTMRFIDTHRLTPAQFEAGI